MNKLNFISEGFKGFIRNGVKTAASVLILSSTLLLIGVFLSLVIVINESVSNIDDFNEIIVYMNKEYTKEQVDESKDKIESLDHVSKVTFKSKADSLELEKKKFSEEGYDVDFFDSYDDSTNPLPDTLIVEYEPGLGLKGINALAYKLEHIDIDGDGDTDAYFDKILNRFEIANNINNFKNIISIAGTWIMILILSFSLFFISNTINLTYHSREMEISVMRYIGATKRYITMPFIFEGALTGISSACIGYLLQYYLYSSVFKMVEDSAKIRKFIVVPSFSDMNIYYVPVFFISGLLIGILGSAFAIRKYLKA